MATYIQSVNVLFASPSATERATLARRIEALLDRTFDYRAGVVLRTTNSCRPSSSAHWRDSLRTRRGTGTTSSS